MSVEDLRKQLYSSFKNRAMMYWKKIGRPQKKTKVQLNLADNNIGEIVIFPVLSRKPQNSNSPISVQRSACGSSIR
jgi:hypothetical protein